MKILIVDDIFSNRLLISEIIKDLGFECLEATNGRDAIEILNTVNGIDAILMDIEMPVMNGIETTKYIREKIKPPKNRIPIIALTAHNPEIFFQDYKEVGFDQLLTKPYSVNKIIEIFEKLKIKTWN